MNAHTRIDDIAAADVDLTAIMRREGIETIRQYRVGMFFVQLFDGYGGTARTVGEALAKARGPQRMWMLPEPERKDAA